MRVALVVIVLLLAATQHYAFYAASRLPHQSVEAHQGPQHYVLTPIVNFPDDSVACAKEGGRAALVAALDAEGNLAEGWATFCVKAVVD